MSDREIAAELTREGQAMAHLPECLLSTCVEPCACCVCICDRLRQAEQRGRLIQSAVEVDTAVINQNRSYGKGYAAGLTAAREAVRTKNWAKLWSREDGSVWVPLDDALAAIDALKEES